MQKSLTVLSAALLFCSWALCASPAAASVAIGKPAPDFTATDISGKAVKLSDYKGKIVVLEWTSNECPIVKKHYDSGNMQKLQKLASAEGVVWLSVDSSGPKNAGYMDGKAAAAWIKDRNAAPTDLLVDASGSVGHLYGAKTTPHMFVIDKNGNLVYAGAIDSIPSSDQKDIAKATNYVQAALDALQAGKPVAVAETQSYGCGVKYGE
jgi:peroxiredoxin